MAKAKAKTKTQRSQKVAIPSGYSKFLIEFEDGDREESLSFKEAIDYYDDVDADYVTPYVIYVPVAYVTFDVPKIKALKKVQTV